MRTIWKYSFQVKDNFEIMMPFGARILAVQVQNAVPCLWVQVNSEMHEETRRFQIIGTGHQFNPAGLAYVGTFQMMGGQLVWHLYETGQETDDV